MINRNRQTKNEEIDVCSDLRWGSSVDDVISKLQKVKTQLERKGCVNIKLQVDAQVSYEDSIIFDIKVEGERPESDDELNARIASEEAREKKWEQERKKQYESLKKEFEKT